jgi:hypothetical protein
MGIQLWILFILGVVALIMGLGLIAYGVVQKQTNAGTAKDIAQVISAFAELGRVFGKTFPQQATRVGFILILLGLALIFLPFYVPGLKP